MYAVVKTGGRQYRVAVGDVLDVGTIAGERGDTVSLPALLVVDGSTVTSAAADLAGVTVTGEVIEHGRGPKIRILKYKNKTGYRKRQGHRQGLTRLKVTGIDANGTVTDGTVIDDTVTDDTATHDTATNDTATNDSATNETDVNETDVNETDVNETDVNETDVNETGE